MIIIHPIKILRRTHDGVDLYGQRAARGADAVEGVPCQQPIRDALGEGCAGDSCLRCTAGR